jgi:phage-related protein
MREIMITSECSDFIESQDKRVSLKFYQIIEVMMEVKVVHSAFVKKLINTDFYELRIKAGNEIRVIMFAIDHSSFIESKKVICLNGFVKKSNKDYKKAIKISEKLLKDYI